MGKRKRTPNKTSLAPSRDSCNQRTSGFCMQCRRLNMEDVVVDHITLNQSATQKITIAKESTCPLCCFIRSVSVPNTGKHNALSLPFEAHMRLIPIPLRPFCYTVQLSVPNSAQHRYIIPHKGGHNVKRCTSYIRSVSKEVIDWSIPKNWLSLCETNHAESCALPYVSHKQLPQFGFKLIDCETRTIVRADLDYKYVALSYVWGIAPTALVEPAPIVPDSDQLLDLSLGQKATPLGKASKTVEDAILATLALDFRYIWVDKHCIFQHDSADLYTQLPMMNQIYESASMTIIAAAGINASYGLPGLSCARDGPPTLQVEETVWLATHGSIASALQLSPWYERAWTYQEAIFSHRRLIFTDEQLFFECNESACCEMIAFDSNTELKGDCPDDAVSIRSSLRLDTLSFVEHLELYTKRTLTHQGDILKAVQGLFRSFTLGDRPQWQYWGIPTEPRSYSRYKTWVLTATHPVPHYAQLHAAISYGMLWYPVGSGNSPRRPGFPSWSWCGWITAVAWPKWNRLQSNRNSDVPHILAERGLLSACVVERVPDKNEFYSHGNLFVLGIDSDVLEVQFTYFKDWSKPFHSAIVDPARHPGVDRIRYAVTASVQVDTTEGSQQYTIAWPLVGRVGLGGTGDHDTVDSALRKGRLFRCVVLYRHCAVVVRKTGTGYERIGLIDLCGFPLEPWDTNAGLPEHVPHRTSCLRNYVPCRRRQIRLW